MTANLREWRHVLKLRTSQAAHPDMRRIMLIALSAMKMMLPVFFEDIGELTGDNGYGVVTEHDLD